MIIRSIKLGSMLLLAITFSSTWASAQDTEDALTLTIGSVAPPLDIEHWVQDGQGAFKPVQQFQKDKVYVVEFWATWCGPCVASMPHLSKLQNEYKEKGVQVVSISDEDLETVEAFLKRNVPQRGEEEKKEQTFAQLTQNYCLTTDPDRSVYSDYMKAAGQNGIPCAFLVGKTGRIEWIGHPMSMDAPLAAVVDGTWDATAFAAEFRKEQEMQAQRARVSRLLRGASLKEQLGIVNDELAKAEGDFKSQLKMLKFNLLMTLGEGEQLTAMTSEILSELKDPSAVNNFAWNVFQFAQRGRIKDKAVIAAVLEASEQASDETTGQGKAMLLDTIAHLHHQLGDLAKAIETQREAVAAGGDGIAEIAAYLKKLEAERDEKLSEK